MRRQSVAAQVNRHAHAKRHAFEHALDVGFEGQQALRSMCRVDPDRMRVSVMRFNLRKPDDWPATSLAAKSAAQYTISTGRLKT